MGNSGLKITQLTLGTALTIGTQDHSQEYAEALVDMAWQTGIRSFDTSNNYGSGEAETLLGKCLKKYPRHMYVLATKGSWPVGDSVYERGLSRKHILWALEQSLERLGMDYVDLYYAHRPDPEVPMEEIARTFNALIAKGRIRYWATSEWSVGQLEELHKVCDQLSLEKPIAEQFIYSYAIRKAEYNGVKAFCDNHGVGTLAFSPIAQGLLTGKYKKGIPKDSRISKSNKIAYHKTIAIYEQNNLTIDFFVNQCEKYCINGIAAALQWCLRRHILPVMGASQPEQIRINVQALQEEIPQAFWDSLEDYIR